MRPTSPSELLAEADIGAFLVSDRVNIRYVTGLELSAGFLLALPRSYHLFVDGRYREVAERQVPDNMRVHDLSLLPRAFAKVPECGIEAEVVTLAQWARWKRQFKDTKFVQIKGLLQGFRRQKDAKEIALFRRAQSLTRELLARVPAYLRKSVTERSLAWQFQVWAHELGADGLAFDPIVAFGTNTSRPHHRPTDRHLKKGHLVQVDVGVKYRGYCADLSAVFFTAKMTTQEERVLTAVRDALNAVRKAVKPGATNHTLHAAEDAVFQKYGVGYLKAHSLGHGVGLEIHEGISLSDLVPEKALLKNEIMAIEPGLYLPGRFGMRLEEDVIV
ncbi:MAG: Xaa-Pro peptidase family protein [Candidatus Peribacteraceae bacterium]|nr:Xaa-Pro peptidase family protein [Candidatus Peribacteraceae bacterium]